MAQYMTGQQMASYNEEMMAANNNPNVMENITDDNTGDVSYDFDGDKWIFFGDYWIKPDGTISYTPPNLPPVVNPVQPVTPGDTLTPRDDEDEDDPDDNGADDYDYEGPGILDRVDEDVTGWGTFFKEDRDYKAMGDGTWMDKAGNILSQLDIYDIGNRYAQGLGLDPTDLDLYKLGGSVLAGGVGGVIAANAAPFAKNAVEDWRNNRDNEAEKDFIEDQDLGYATEIRMGNALDEYRSGNLEVDRATNQQEAERQAIKEAAIIAASMSDEKYNSGGREATINIINERLANQGFGPLSEDPKYLDGTRADYTNMLVNSAFPTSVPVVPGSTTPTVDAVAGNVKRPQPPRTPDDPGTDYNPFGYGLAWEEEQARIAAEKAAAAEAARQAAENAKNNTPGNSGSGSSGGSWNYPDDDGNYGYEDDDNDGSDDDGYYHDGSNWQEDIDEDSMSDDELNDWFEELANSDNDEKDSGGKKK